MESKGCLFLSPSESSVDAGAPSSSHIIRATDVVQVVENFRLARRVPRTRIPAYERHVCATQ